MLIRIGRALLYLGDCREWLPIIGAVDAVVTDPPFLFNASGGGRFRKERHAMDGIIDNGLDEGFDINIFDFSLYKSFITFCHNNQIHTIAPILAAAYHRHVFCFWEKSNPMPVANKNYQSNIECYIHAWQHGAHPTGNLIDLKRTVQNVNGKSPYKHPTVKPDIVMNKIIRNTNACVILDPYMGTGSTGIAALRAGKDFIGIEKNPAFFNIACQRFYALYSV